MARVKWAGGGYASMQKITIPDDVAALLYELCGTKKAANARIAKRVAGTVASPAGTWELFKTKLQQEVDDRDERDKLRKLKGADPSFLASLFDKTEEEVEKLLENGEE